MPGRCRRGGPPCPPSFSWPANGLPLTARAATGGCPYESGGPLPRTETGGHGQPGNGLRPASARNVGGQQTRRSPLRAGPSAAVGDNRAPRPTRTRPAAGMPRRSRPRPTGGSEDLVAHLVGTGGRPMRCDQELRPGLAVAPPNPVIPANEAVVLTGSGGEWPGGAVEAYTRDQSNQFFGQE